MKAQMVKWGNSLGGWPRPVNLLLRIEIDVGAPSRLRLAGWGSSAGLRIIPSERITSTNHFGVGVPVRETRESWLSNQEHPPGQTPPGWGTHFIERGHTVTYQRSQTPEFPES
jgi:hypothetical protein